MKNYIPCSICGKRADWSYMPGDKDYCDKHVPRGCSCNINEDGIEDLDDKGRQLPCCEFWEISEERHNDKEFVKMCWELYYKDKGIKEMDEMDEVEESIERIHKGERNKLWGRENKSKPKGFKHNRKNNNKRNF